MTTVGITQMNYNIQYSVSPGFLSETGRHQRIIDYKK